MFCELLHYDLLINGCIGAEEEGQPEMTNNIRGIAKKAIRNDLENGNWTRSEQSKVIRSLIGF